MMFSDCQDILDQSKIKLVYQNMDQPLSHYWIASSHNTYLLGNQARNFFIPGWKTLNQKKTFRTYHLVQLIEHPILRIPNFNFPNLCNVLQSVFFFLFNITSYIGIFWVYFDINLKLLSGKTNKIFGIRKIGCSMS